MKLAGFDPPGFLKDFNANQKTAWSKSLSDILDAEIRGQDPRDSPRPQFYNPVKTDTAADVETLEITWTAFPRKLEIAFPTDEARWAAADKSRNVQDEYCEWAVIRDPGSNKITRVMFTAEGPEYWKFLASTSRTKLLSLYQKLVDPAVKLQDLYDASGRYIPDNRWNNSTRDTIVHLIQPNNTLGAELNIAARATIVRQISGRVLTGERELIDCGRYGDPERHSDPHIGAQINMLAREKADITIANPIGLYLDSLSTAGWKTPDGSNPAQYWKITRGTSTHALRAVYAVPANKNFVVGDITINGIPITYGAQIADFITIAIRGQACRFGKSAVQPKTVCN